MRVTYKTCILYYTVINLIALGGTRWRNRGDKRGRAASFRGCWFSASCRHCSGSTLVYLGHANGVMVLYDPPKWGNCEVDSCRGVVWR